MFKFIKRILCQNKTISLLEFNYRLCNGVSVKVSGGNREYPFAQWLVIYFWRFNQDQEHHFFAVQPITLAIMALSWYIIDYSQGNDYEEECSYVLGQLIMNYKMNKENFSNYDREILDKKIIYIDKNLKQKSPLKGLFCFKFFIV